MAPCFEAHEKIRRVFVDDGAAALRLAERARERLHRRVRARQRPAAAGRELGAHLPVPDAGPVELARRRRRRQDPVGVLAAGRSDSRRGRRRRRRRARAPTRRSGCRRACGGLMSPVAGSGPPAPVASRVNVPVAHGSRRCPRRRSRGSGTRASRPPGTTSRRCTRRCPSGCPRAGSSSSDRSRPAASSTPRRSAAPTGTTRRRRRCSAPSASDSSDCLVKNCLLPSVARLPEVG